MGGQRHAAAALPPRERDPVSIVQEAGWAPGPARIGRENLEPWTVQPLASRYTDYAISAGLLFKCK